MESHRLKYHIEGEFDLPGLVGWQFQVRRSGLHSGQCDAGGGLDGFHHRFELQQALAFANLAPNFRQLGVAESRQDLGLARPTHCRGAGADLKWLRGIFGGDQEFADRH